MVMQGEKEGESTEQFKNRIKELYQKEAEYRKAHPTEYWTDYVNRLKPFTLDSWCEPPIVSEDIYETIIVPAWIRLGAIPKKDLVSGKTYLGHCRNASEAIWNGDKFTYTRYEFGYNYKETINHFEDFTECDVFVPLKLEGNESENSSEN